MEGLGQIDLGAVVDTGCALDLTGLLLLLDLLEFLDFGVSPLHERDLCVVEVVIILWRF